MANTFSSVTAYTLADLAQYYDPQGKMYTMINQLAQDNVVLEHALWVRGNQTNSHKGKIVTALPSVDFRRLYQGTAYSKAGIATIEEPCRQISSRFGVDIDELKMYEGSADRNAFRMQEGELHVEAMRQFAVEQMFYGSPTSDADELRGLAAHYAYKDAPNVVNGGGTTGNCCSIWAVVWGEKAFHGIYPKNMPAGLEHEDLGKFDAVDASGYPYRAVGDEWKWNLGFFLHDWRMVARICNIVVANLSITDTSDEDYIDLRALTIQAKNKIPQAYRSRIKWYVPNAIMNALEVQAGNPNNVHLRYGEYTNSQEVLKLHGKPVFEADSLLETESALSAM